MIYLKDVFLKYQFVKKMNGIEIVSTGYAKIEKTLDNQQLEQMVETSNEWIVSPLKYLSYLSIFFITLINQLRC